MGLRDMIGRSRSSVDAEYERRKAKFIKQADGTYKCKDCDSTILSTTVAHPIHDGPFPLSGSGRCKYEAVPYCPKCEKKPDFHGAAIKQDSW